MPVLESWGSVLGLLSPVGLLKLLAIGDMGFPSPLTSSATGVLRFRGGMAGFRGVPGREPGPMGVPGRGEKGSFMMAADPTSAAETNDKAGLSCSNALSKVTLACRCFSFLHCVTG